MLIMQEEIFGPLLPVKTFTQSDEALAWINAHPRPLAAYYFGNNAASQATFITNTTSGAVVINDVMAHAALDGLPFGGVCAHLIRTKPPASSPFCKADADRQHPTRLTGVNNESINGSDVSQ